MSKKRKTLAFGLTATLVIVMAGAGTIWWLRNRQTTAVLGASYTAQIPFNMLYPTAASSVTTDESRAHYSEREQLAVIEADHAVARTRLVFSQQPLPDELKSAERMADLVDTMAQYGSFQSKFGKVWLTRPPKYGGKQSAVLATDSTLVFIQADDDLTDEQWRNLFESLVAVP